MNDDRDHTLHDSLTTPPQPRRGAVGKALIVWLLSGSLGLALLALIFFGAIGC